MSERDHIIETYSKLADAYDGEGNQGSCWGRASRALVGTLRIEPRHRTVVDVGCGAGHALEHWAGRVEPGVALIGVEPAAGLRERAAARLARFAGVRVVDGRFEDLPLDDGAADYLYSIMAFHWVRDPQRAVRELARVLGAGGEADLYFIGRRNGREFVKATTPIFLRYLGPAGLLEAARHRYQRSADDVARLFREAFAPERIDVDEDETTHYDSLEGHWSWWVRIEGQFVEMAPDVRARCDAEVREALARLETPRGIPYTLHTLHVRIDPAR